MIDSDGLVGFLPAVFDKLVELIPAKFYVPNDEASDTWVWPRLLSLILPIVSELARQAGALVAIEPGVHNYVVVAVMGNPFLFCKSLSNAKTIELRGDGKCCSGRRLSRKTRLRD